MRVSNSYKYEHKGGFMFCTIYRITNRTDGKVYIGSHKTNKLDDGYMGSGKYLRHAQAKYGIDNFVKEILFVFETVEEMYAKEAELVDKAFVAAANTYNLKVGGFGGWDYVNNPEVFINPSHAREHMCMMSRVFVERRKSDPDVDIEWRKRISDGVKPVAQLIVEKRRANGWISTTKYMNTPEVNEKRKRTFAEINHQVGCKNNQYGTRWIYSMEEKISKKISKEAPLPYGWLEGRKIKF